MIKHQPFGSGHAYLVSDDQRVPPRPEAGGPIELRVTTASSDGAPICEWESGGSVRRLTMRPVEDVSPSALLGSESMTHLAAAAAGLSGRARRKWSLQVGPLEATEVARYRFTAHTADDDERSTRWFDVAPAQWLDDRGVCSGSSARTGMFGCHPMVRRCRWRVSRAVCVAIETGERVLGLANVRPPRPARSPHRCSGLRAVQGPAPPSGRLRRWP